MQKNNKTRILIIDDDPKICEELTKILKDENYDVVCVNNGDQARQILKKIPVNLVLLDLRLPDVSGFDLIKDIKTAGEDTFIIIITAYASLESSIKALREQVYDYILKPLKPQALLAIIKEALNKQIINKRLKEKMATLEQFQKVVTGRELEMIELKKEIKELKEKIKTIDEKK